MTDLTASSVGWSGRTKLDEEKDDVESHVSL